MRSWHFPSGTLLAAIVFLTLLLCSAAMSQDKRQSVFKPLPKQVLDQMERQRAFVIKLLYKYAPEGVLKRNEEDFPLLQKIVDSKSFARDDTWEWQALGIVFGDALAGSMPDLAWCEVTDEYGTDPTLRFKQTTLQINAMTMLSKRAEDGKEIDIAHMAGWIRDFIQNKAAEYR